jgi:hypothetical protein
MDQSRVLTPGLDRRTLDDKSGLKPKEEHRSREDDLLAAERDRAERERAERERAAERDRMERAERERMEREREAKQRELQNSYLSSLGVGSLAGVSPHPPHAHHPLGLGGLLDRTRLLPGSSLNPYLAALDPRLPSPAGPLPGLWQPYDKAAELSHRLELERAAERERLAMLQRLTGGLGNPLSLLDQERRLIQEQQEVELRRAQFLPPYDRMLAYEKSLASLAPFSRSTVSPMYNHALAAAASKNGSPTTLPPGIPPPLIPSATATAGPSRSHDNSPSSSKTKGYSAADSTSDLKDKRDGVKPECDTHSVR